MDFVGNVTLGDVQQAWAAARSLDANPVRLVGRLAGLGSDELDAGIPTWAWVVMAFGTGVVVTAVWGDDIADRVSSAFR